MKPHRLLQRFLRRIASTTTTAVTAAARRRNLPGPRSHPPSEATPTGLPPELARMIRPAASVQWLQTSARYYTPSLIESILRLGLAGDLVAQWQLFQLMEDTWPRLNKNLLELKRAVVSMDREILPAATHGGQPHPEAARRARLVEEALLHLRPGADTEENGLAATLFDLLDAWAKGVSVLEIDWRIAPGSGSGESLMFAPRATRWIHPQHYTYLPHAGRLVLRATADTVGHSLVDPRFETDGGIPFPANKFLIAQARARTGILTGAALLRPLAFWWAAANLTSEWLLNFAQLFGVPFRWATYDPHNPSILPALEQMLSQIGNSGWAAFPEGTRLELKEASKTGTDNPQAYVQTLADRLCDILVLGQTLTTEVGASGSRALGQVHKGVRDEVILSAGAWLDEILSQQLIPAILRLNYGDDRFAPRVQSSPRRPDDALLMARRDQLLLNLGVPLPAGWFYQRHDIPRPTDGESLVTTLRTRSGTPATPPASNPTARNSSSNADDAPATSAAVPVPSAA